MRQTILFFTLLTFATFPQLKEMELKTIEYRGGNQIFQDYPGKAAIIFYTKFENLTVNSSYGIVKVSDDGGGKYVVIIEPVKQTIEVRAPGFKTEMIKIESLQPLDVFYYEVLAKNEEDIGVITEVGVTVQVTPPGAEITIDGESFLHNRTKKLVIGNHRMKIEKKDYVTYDRDIVVSTEMTLFQIELKYDVASTLVKVEGGTFTMGFVKGRDGEEAGYNETPAHKVTLSNFLISKYEVTHELWESVMGSNPWAFKGSKRPVEQFSWLDFVEFCNSLSLKEGLKPAYSINGSDVECDFNSDGYRLPTEAEWEYAARGGNKSKGYKYSGSNNVDAVAWYYGNIDGQTHDVGTKQPNELGLYDMSGNVWESCWDQYGAYSSGSQTNPRGSNLVSERVLRGGHFHNNAEDCRVAHRSTLSNFASRMVGFRLVRTK